MESKVLKIINSILSRKGHSQLNVLDLDKSLRKDYGFDSLDLAELTVKIEDQFDCDIFEDGPVDFVREIVGKLSNA